MSATIYIPVSIYIHDLWVTKGGGLFSGRPKAILQEVSFHVQPGNFVAVIGPNGAGKTTMLRAMIGERPVRGQILLHMGEAPVSDHENLYDNPEYWMQQIGYVPVENILHEDLTIRQALMHVGKLRLPTLTEEAIAARMLEKLVGLGFEKADPRLDQLIKTLSSGERKRVNIAAELLTNPPLLLLDEPTSNLDPNAERDLMDSLSKLAGSSNNGNGPTILLITHTLASINRCDQAVFIENSRLKVEGTPEAVFDYLATQLKTMGISLPEERMSFEAWAVIFDVYKADQTAANRDRALPPAQKYPQAPRRHVEPGSLWGQLRVLSSRYFLIRLNDFNGIPVILISGFLAGFLLLIAPDNIFLESDDATPARQTVVLYTILIVIVGAFLSHREISKEFRIYLHERAKGLLPVAYLLSKVLWLSVVVGIFVSGIILALSGMQLPRYLVLICGIILLFLGLSQVRRMSPKEAISRTLWITAPFFLAYFVQFQNKAIPEYPLDPSRVEIYIVITYILTCIAAIALGITVSAIVGANNDRATQIAIAVILVNVILAFSALIVATKDFQWLFDTLKPSAASHWGYRGMSSSLGIYCWAAQHRLENFNSFGHIGATWILLLAQTVICLGIATIGLRFQETWFTRTEKFKAIFSHKSSWAFAVMSAALLSWSIFLISQSDHYFKLTFFDVLYGGSRYAHIETIDNRTDLQTFFGKISESACGKTDEPLPEKATAFGDND